MLDPDEQAEYEAWRMHKLTTHPDLSVAAYNTEMAAVAVAWEEGARASHKVSDDIDSLLERNPYRKPGMRGARRADARLSGTSSIPRDPEDES